MTLQPDGAGNGGLLGAARALFLSQGFAEVSMQEIAKAAGMTKGAPYYHFKNNEDLFLTDVLREIEHQTAGFVAKLDEPGTVEGRLV